MGKRKGRSSVPTTLEEGAARHSGLIALLVRDGIELNQARLKAGVPLSQAGGLTFREFIPERMTPDQLDGYALLAGSDAGAGFLVRHMLAGGFHLDVEERS